MREKKERKEKESSSEVNSTALKSFENGFKIVDKELYADMRTLFEQDVEAWKEAQRRGLDVKDSFRMMKLENEGDDPHYHVFSTRGRERRVEEEMNRLNTERFIVDNKSVQDYREIVEEERLMEQEEEIRERIRGEIEMEEAHRKRKRIGEEK